MAASAAAATAADAATRRPGPGARPEKLPNGIRLGGVELTTNRGHILESRCALGESESCSVDDPSAQICDFCRCVGGEDDGEENGASQQQASLQPTNQTD